MSAAVASPHYISHGIENRIRLTAQTRGVRVNGFFYDYDGLRSGFVTAQQFFRVLWSNLQIKLTPEEEDAIIKKYDLKGNGRLSYKLFCENIAKRFDANDVQRDPTLQKSDPIEFLGTMRSVRPLSPGAEKRIEGCLLRMQAFYKYHGINLRTCYEDFDVHHRGRITESMFYRNFPGPGDVTEEEKNMLVKKYRDPENPGLIVYLNLHHDLVAIQQQLAMKEINLNDIGNYTDYLPTDRKPDPALQTIFDKIRVAVFKNGVRTHEYFKDHDKLRSGIVTENQFVCGISLCIGKEAQLSRPEIQKLVEFYRVDDGRVAYKEFCDMMENVFNIPDLDKKPTQTVTRPPRGALGRTLKLMDDASDERIDEVINRIKQTVQERRIIMYQYFKDYDRSKAYTRVMTPTQFARMLHFLGLNVSGEDLKLLSKKFADPATGDINYPAFVQSVDQEFVLSTVDDPVPDVYKSPYEESKEKPVDTSSVDFDSFMARLRSHVLTNRLRVCVYFEDYDPLRSGEISVGQFRRALSSLGLSKLGHHELTDAQFQVMADYYRNPKKPDMVFWKNFERDIESVFTQPNLEKTPAHSVPAQELFRVPKPGTVDWRNASVDHMQNVNEAMERLRRRIGTRRILPKPTFQDFDRHNNGHVTRGQFRQVVMTLELDCTEEEMSAIEGKFYNDTGFNYLQFLEELEPKPVPESLYLGRIKNLRQTNAGKILPEILPCGDFEELIEKLKSKVKRERIRVHEYMKDYDKLRSSRMPKISFRRALDLCRFEMKESEISMIEDKYQSREDPGYVDWTRFSDEMETVFTVKELEKQPLRNVEQYIPPTEYDHNTLANDDVGRLQAVMGRLAERVQERRMQLYPLFEDFDKVHNGTVTHSQFRRTLVELEIASVVSELDFEAMFKKYDVRIGGKNVFKYTAFCEDIYDICGFEYRKP